MKKGQKVEKMGDKMKNNTIKWKKLKKWKNTKIEKNEKNEKQAGAELCQAQGKLNLFWPW